MSSRTARAIKRNPVSKNQKKKKKKVKIDIILAKKVPAPDSVTYEFCQALKEEILQTLKVWQEIEESEHLHPKEFNKRWGGLLGAQFQPEP